MVSRQEGTLYSTRKRDATIYGEELHNSFKRSKQEDQSQGKLQITLFSEPPKSESVRSITFDFQLHLHHPLPPISQEPNGYSTTSEDHRTYPNDPVIVGGPNMSLDLELNLSPSFSPSNTTTKIDESSNHNETESSKGDDDNDVDHKEQEMVTKVCMKCHMLVMLCTSTPVCPNCKFMHPPDHSSTQLFKPSNLLKLLC